MGKGSRDHTPKRKRQPQRAAVERDQDEANKPVRSLDPFSPFAKRMRADQERLRRFAERHGLAEAEESLRRFGEKSGLKQFAEAVERRNAKTSPPSPQQPTPRQAKPRKEGGGNKPLLSEKQIKDGKAIYRRLADDQTWAENKTASAARVIELLKLGKSVSVWTVKRWIVDPVLKEREQNKQRR